MRLRLLAAVVALATGLVAPRADAAAAGREQGKELAARAAEVANRGDYELAITTFRAALAADPELEVARFQLARVLAFLGRFEESRVEFATIVAAHPQHATARRGEVTALLMLERWAEARKKLEEGIAALPRDGQLAHLLARVLATAPDDKVRDGRIALELARKVYEVRPLRQTGETIAMAHAELGEFDRAFSVQAVLITQARDAGDEAAVAELEKRLEAYHAKKPWRAASGDEIAWSTEPPDAAPPPGGG